MSDSLWPHGLQHARPPCLSPSPRVCPSSCPLNRWCHPAISSSNAPLCFCLQSFSASGSFLVNQLLTSGGQSIETSASASVFPMNIQGLFPLRSTDLISLQSKGLSGVFSSNTVCKQLSHLYITTEKSIVLTVMDLCWQSDVSAFSDDV